MLFDSFTAPRSRRDFLLGVFGRAVAEVPDGVANAANAMARDGGSSAEASEGASAELLARAFAVPADQLDVATALVRRNRLREVAPGRYVERFAMGSPGAAAAERLRRVRDGAPPDRARPRDVILVQAARGELATT